LERKFILLAPSFYVHSSLFIRGGFILFFFFFQHALVSAQTTEDVGLYVTGGAQIISASGFDLVDIVHVEGGAVVYLEDSDPAAVKPARFAKNTKKQKAEYKSGDTKRNMISAAAKKTISKKMVSPSVQLKIFWSVTAPCSFFKSNVQDRLCGIIFSNFTAKKAVGICKNFYNKLIPVRLLNKLCDQILVFPPLYHGLYTKFSRPPPFFI
jgi:hypothetical protein